MFFGLVTKHACDRQTDRENYDSQVRASVAASHGKNGISGSFTFHKSKLHIIYLNLLPNSVFKDPFHHFHSMFQQSNSSVRSTD